MSASQLPIEQLGSTIKAHVSAAEKYAGKAEEHYKSAGIHLLEAKQRIAAGEYEGKFGRFLMLECNSLSSSRAYELISIGNGTKTVEAVRSEGAARQRAHRARKAAPAAPAPGKATPVRDVTEPAPPSEAELAEKAAAFAARCADFMHLFAPIPPPVQLDPYPEPPETSLIYKIEAACTLVSLDTLTEVLQILRRSRMAPAALAAREHARDAAVEQWATAVGGHCP